MSHTFLGIGATLTVLLAGLLVLATRSPDRQVEPASAAATERGPALPLACEDNADLPGAVPAGVVGSALGGLPCSAPPPPPPTPVRVGGSIKPPAKLKDVPPHYPAAARATGIEGSVLIEIVVAPNGRVADTKVLRSIPALDQAALSAVRQWEFVPPTLGGRSAAVIMTVAVPFRLD
jgi:periplasmic protein TonB